MWVSVRDVERRVGGIIWSNLKYVAHSVLSPRLRIVFRLDWINVLSYKSKKEKLKKKYYSRFTDFLHSNVRCSFDLFNFVLFCFLKIIPVSIGWSTEDRTQDLERLTEVSETFSCGLELFSDS